MAFLSLRNGGFTVKAIHLLPGPVITASGAPEFDGVLVGSGYAERIHKVRSREHRKCRVWVFIENSERANSVILAVIRKNMDL